MLFAECQFLLALAPSSHVDFASYLVFESINSFFATTLVLGSSIGLQNKSVQGSLGNGLFHFLLYLNKPSFTYVRFAVWTFICIYVSNALAPHKSLRFVSQHLSLLEARGDGHWAALEKRETNSQGSCLERGKAGAVLGFYRLQCRHTLCYGAVPLQADMGEVFWQLWRSGGLVPTEH